MDNLKQLTQNVDVALPIGAGVASVKVANHNPLNKSIIAKVGKYTGFPFNSRRKGGEVETGDLCWDNNPMNQEASFDIDLSITTLDGNNIERIVSLMKTGDLIHFKDFVGRSVTLKFISYRDKATENAITLTVQGFAENTDYVYQPTEAEICIIEFITSGIGTITPEAIKALYEANDDTNAFTDEEKEKLEFIEEGAQENVIEKIFVNGVEQTVTAQKEVKLTIAQNEKIIQSQLVTVTNTVGTNYSIVAVASAPNKIIWQNNVGVIKTKETNFTSSYDIDTATNNVILCLWLGYDGTMGIKTGTVVATGVFPSYPTPPVNTITYGYIVFNAGSVKVQMTLTPQQIQDIVTNAKPTVVEFTANATLSDLLENKYLIVNGNVTLTIPTGLLATFFQLFVFVQTGSLTIALQVGVTAIGYYSLIIYPNDRTTITKRSPTTNEYIII